MFFWLLLSPLECGGQGGNRTPDASLFRAALYQLSYLAKEGLVYQIRLCFRLLNLLPLPGAPLAFSASPETRRYREGCRLRLFRNRGAPIAFRGLFMGGRFSESKLSS